MVLVHPGPGGLRATRCYEFSCVLTTRIFYFSE